MLLAAVLLVGVPSAFRGELRDAGDDLTAPDDRSVFTTDPEGVCAVIAWILGAAARSETDACLPADPGDGLVAARYGHREVT